MYSDKTEKKYNQNGALSSLKSDKITKDFWLQDGILKLKIKPNDDTKIFTNMIYSKNEYLPMSGEIALKAILTWILKLFRSNAEIPVEVYRTISEEVIPCDSVVTTFGRLEQSSADLAIVPAYIGYSRDCLLKHVRKNIASLYMCTFILGAFTLYPLYKALSKRKERRELENSYHNMRAIIPEGFHCVICLDNPRDAIIEPCLHMCVCQVCSQIIRNCPICRAGITNITRVYFS